MLGQRLTKQWKLAVIIVIAGVLVSLLLLLNRPGITPKASPERTWVITVQTLQVATHAPNVVLYGKVETPRDANLTAAVHAEVAETPRKEGEAVRKGQLLIRLDPRDAQLVVQQRQADVTNIKAQIATEKVRNENDKAAIEREKKIVDLSKAQLERLKNLAKRHHAAAVSVDQAESKLHQDELNLLKRELALKDYQHRLQRFDAQLQRAAALLDRAKIDLQRTEIRSPFNGRLAKLSVAVGDWVRPGSELAEVFDTGNLEVRAEIPAKYLAMVRQALAQKKPMMAAANVDGIAVKLHLVRLASEVEQGSSGEDGLFRVQNGELLALGRTVELLLTLPPQKDTVLLPISALYGLNRVYVVKKQRLQAVQVERVGSMTTPAGKQFVLLKSPHLRQGDQVMITHLPNAMSGLKVRITKEGAQ